MFGFLLSRAGAAVITILLASVLNFLIISLPPGDYIARLEAQQSRQSGVVTKLENVRVRYGLDKPIIVQYWKWITGFVQGDLGLSMKYDTEVRDLVGGRLVLSLVLSTATLLFTWAVAIPIGVYVAVRKYGLADNVLTIVGFIGLALPNFLLALLLVYISLFWFDAKSVGGLFSREFRDAAWSFARVWDLMQHLWIPVVVIGTAGTAGLIRIMRTNLLETFGEMYILTARAKGLRERSVVWKHAVRVAINPLISILGMSLPFIIGGEIIVSIVLNLPTLGPLFYEALLLQDMYLAGGILMILTLLLVIGNFLADLLLVWADPRIKFS